MKLYKRNSVAGGVKNGQPPGYVQCNIRLFAENVGLRPYMFANSVLSFNEGTSNPLFTIATVSSTQTMAWIVGSDVLQIPCTSAYSQSIVTLLTTQGGIGFDPYGPATQVKNIYTGYRNATLTFRSWYNPGLYQASLTLT